MVRNFFRRLTDFCRLSIIRLIRWIQETGKFLVIPLVIPTLYLSLCTHEILFDTSRFSRFSPSYIEYKYICNIRTRQFTFSIINKIHARRRDKVNDSEITASVCTVTVLHRRDCENTSTLSFAQRYHCFSRTRKYFDGAHFLTSVHLTSANPKIYSNATPFNFVARARIYLARTTFNRLKYRERENKIILNAIFEIWGRARDVIAMLRRLRAKVRNWED